MKNHPASRIGMLLVVALAATAPLFGQTATAVRQLEADTGGAASVRLDSATGVARFVRIPGGLAGLPGANAAARAEAFLRQRGALFGIRDFDAQLQLRGSRRPGALGHVSYRQVLDGVPVFGAELKASFDASDALVAVNGVFLPDVAVNTTPSLGAPGATALAVNHVRGKGTLDLEAANATLYVFREGLVRGLPGRDHLVWEIEVVDAGRTTRELVYVDAHDGAIVDQISGIQESLNRQISETMLSSVRWTEGDPDPIPAGWDGGSAAQVAAWQDEIDGARETYNLFGSLTNGAWLSYDGSSAWMRTVNNDPRIFCPNANWNGTSTNYCSGVTGDDTVAHEWGHAYTDFTSDLIYQWQSGALNEAYSDMWGEVVDLLNGRGLDSPGGARSTGACSSFGSGTPSTDNTYRWLSGEDDTAFGGAIRDLWNPKCYGDPGKVTDTQYYCSTGDGGGVHTNSGVPNHTFALMVDGDTYNGQSVAGVGLTKAAHILWEAQNLLTSASGFADFADALESACTALIGQNLYQPDTSSPTGVLSGQSITAADCTEVANAVAATELRTPPSQCGFTTILDPSAPALCDGGAVTSDFSEDWESGGLGTWTASTRAVANPATFDTADWAVVGSLPSGRGGSAAFVADDPSLGDCSSDIEAGVLYLESPEIVLGSSDEKLAFDHWVATELRWDGGNVKVSVNGGAFNLVPSSAFTFNPYNDTLNTAAQGSDDPLAGQAAFTGTDGGSNAGSWGQSQVDLAGIASVGDTIQLRFELGLDGCNGVVGWYVDDVEVYSCGAPDPCGDGYCDGGAGEDCNSCPQDCVGGTSSPAVCGNGLCEAGDGEDCVSCPRDCNGVQKGKPSNRFCCGDGDGTNPVDCTDPACTTNGYSCTNDSVGSGTSYCCGDAVCEGDESCGNCATDCTSGAEICTGGIDEDCNGAIDCADGACSGDPVCVSPPPADCSQYDNRADCKSDSACRWNPPTGMCLPK